MDARRLRTFAPVLACLVPLLTLLAARTELRAQEGDDRPIYLQTPFDLITLKRDGSQHRILPLELPGRKVIPQTSGSLRVRLESDPVDERSIRWAEIEKLELFEELVLAEANRLTAAGQFNEAFRHYAFLLDKYPHVEGLDPAIQTYLFASASDSVSKQEYAEALSTLEELFRRNNGYTSPSGRSVTSALSAVANILLRQYVTAGNYDAARTLLTRLSRQYGDATIPAVAEWRNRIIADARKKAEEVRHLLNENKLLEAQLAARQVLRIWPDLEGAVALARETLQRYPIATIAVLQRAVEPDPSNRLNWAARRTGRLTNRLLVEFVAPGAEGGEYRSPLGTVEHSDDYRQVALQLRPEPAGGSGQAAQIPTGYEIAQRLLAMADVSSPLYYAPWADLVGSVRVSGVYRVEALLRRPHVVPQGYLQVPLVAGDPPWARSLRPYDLLPADESGDPSVTRFVRNADFVGGTPTMPAEVRERFFEDPADAVAALRGGEVYAIDRLFPADAAVLRQDANVIVRPYALPTLHMLVPNLKNPYLDNATFRRALVHAIPRQLILAGLLKGQSVDGCRVITGPFPPGRGPDDPIGYAYNVELAERPFDPGVATLLTRMAQNQLEQLAEKNEEPAPQLKPLILAHPEDAVARFACEIIARQLEALNIPCQTKQLPPGEVTDPSGEYDLLYVAMNVSEPVVDAQLVLGREGISGTTSPYIGLALRRLQEARTWREARDRLQQLHQLAYAEVTVIPLWQLVEHYAYSRTLQGIENETVSLYQNIEQWQLEPVLSGE